MKMMARITTYGHLVYYILNEEGIGIPILTTETVYKLFNISYRSVFNDENWTKWTTSFFVDNRKIREQFIFQCMCRNDVEIIS